MKYLLCAATYVAVTCCGLAASAVVAGFVAPNTATADPGCPEFRNPATGACEPYVVSSQSPYRGEDAFLAQSRTLFAGSTAEDVLELGNALCRGIERGRTPGDLATQLTSGGIDETSAVRVVINAQKLLC